MNDLGARKGAQSFMGLLGFVSVIRPQLSQGSFTLAEDFFENCSLPIIINSFSFQWTIWLPAVQKK